LHAFWKFLLAWLPMLLLIGVWVVAMRRMAKRAPMKVAVQNLEPDALRRLTVALERLAAVLEKDLPGRH